jgi:bacterioferritin-associated ferredoxin
MYVCLCKGLTESDVLRIAQSDTMTGPVEPDTLKAVLGFDDDECCGRCARNIHELVALTARCWACATPSPSNNPS